MRVKELHVPTQPLHVPKTKPLLHSSRRIAKLNVRGSCACFAAHRSMRTAVWRDIALAWSPERSAGRDIAKCRLWRWSTFSHSLLIFMSDGVRIPRAPEAQTRRRADRTAASTHQIGVRKSFVKLYAGHMTCTWRSQLATEIAATRARHPPQMRWPRVSAARVTALRASRRGRGRSSAARPTASAG